MSETAALRAYQHPQITKAAFLAELHAHRAADAFIQGSYGDTDSNGVFRGCAVGCSIESIARRTGANLGRGNHRAYEPYLGVPMVLARLEDRIFEGLPIDLARDWPVRFAEAIPAGADLSGVWMDFLAWVLTDIALPVVDEKYADVRAAITRVAAGMATRWASDAPTAAQKQAVTAGCAYAASVSAYAASASVSAYAASASASASAYAASAADAASAYAAADAAASAADAAAADAADARKPIRQQAYARMADKLCELLAAAPVPETV